MATTCSAPVLPLALPRFRCHNRHSPVISFDLARSITTVSTKTNLQDRSPVQQSPMAGQRAGVPSPSPSPVLAKQSPRFSEEGVPVLSQQSPRRLPLQSPQESPYFLRFSAACAQICHEEFTGESGQRGRRRMHEESALCAHSTLLPPISKEEVLPPAAQQAPPYDQGNFLNTPAQYMMKMPHKAARCSAII